MENKQIGVFLANSNIRQGLRVIKIIGYSHQNMCNCFVLASLFDTIFTTPLHPQLLAYIERIANKLSPMAVAVNINLA